MRTPLLLLLTILLAADEAAPMIGFRGDGSGAFPVDCRFPVDFDGPSGRHIVWKCPLPNWGNGSPIVVGRKAFVVCEAGTPATSTTPLIDTPLLLCIDGDSGAELWRRPLDPFDTLNDAKEAERLRGLRRSYYETAHRQNLAGGKCVYGDWQGVKNQALVGGYGPYVWWDNSMWGRLGMGYCMPTPVSDGKRIFVFTGHRLMSAFDLDGKRLWQVYHHESGIPWGANTEYCGHSPLVVGDRVLMHFLIEGKGENLGLRCHDAATGKVLWTTPTEQLPHNAMGSPVVLRLPLPNGGGEAAVFCFSGELIRVRDGTVLAQKIGWGKRCAGLTGDGVDRIFMACGWHGGGTRKPDEAWTAEGRFGIERAKAPLWQGQCLNLAVRFCLRGDVAEPALLWSERGGPDDAKQARDWTGRGNLDPYPVYHDGRLHLNCGQVWDAATGAVLAQAPADLRGDASEQGIVLAGGFALGQPGNQSKDIAITVLTLGRPGFTAVAKPMLEQRNGNAAFQTPAWKAKVKAETGTDGLLGLWHGWHPSFALPFASGNRLFLRTFDHLWCIGDAAQPFTPSPAFAGRK
jgi:hypothetical protein